MILLEGKKYRLFTKIDSFVWTGQLKDLITKIINKIEIGKEIDVQVGAETKKCKILKIERYISTDINGNKKEGLVWTLEPITNPIPIPLIILALNSLVYIVVGILIYLSLDKVDEIVKETGNTIQKSTPAIAIIGLSLIGYYFITKRA